MERIAVAAEQTKQLPDEDDRIGLLRAVAQGLADDAAGRTMDTKTLKKSLEDELGPIAWP
jgi:hypothetical protein